jgi:hypothetical protein
MLLLGVFRPAFAQVKYTARTMANVTQNILKPFCMPYAVDNLNEDNPFNDL